MTTKEDILARCFPQRDLGAHKYSVGTVTVLGGSAHFIHAPVIAALGARCCGAGLVNMVVPDASKIVAGMLVPEATFTKLTPTCVPPRSDVMVAGMGLGVTSTSEMQVSRILSGSAGNFVLDADALNVLAKWYAAKPEAFPAIDGQRLVFTPHEGEAARLLACTPEKVRQDREAAVRELARRYHATVALKGAHTLVVQPGEGGMFYRCLSGNPYMALGGMGDLLAGMLAARWAYLEKSGVENAAFWAACSAVWLHAEASDAIVNAEEPGDPSVRETARKAASMRVKLERGAARHGER